MRVVRSISDFEIRGDAWTWWASAEGSHSRSAAPARGSVMVFKKSARLNRGHVSLVSAVLNERTVLVDHSWLGGRGLRRGMRVEDVSPRNDWSQVRVWHEPSRQMGQRVYPLYGFIMPKGAPADTRFAVAPRGRGAPAPAVEMRTAALKVVPGHKPAQTRGMMVASLPQTAAPVVKTVAAAHTVTPGHKPGQGAVHALAVVALPETAGILPARKPGTATAKAVPAAPTVVAVAGNVRSALPGRKPGTPLFENEQVADAFAR